MRYEQIEFIRTNCLMRKWYRVYGAMLDNLSFEDCMSDEDFIWNFEIDKDDIAEYLELLMECLNDDEKRIVYLKFFESKTFRQIKEEFSVSHQMIHKKFHRALKKMKKRAEKLKAYHEIDL